jgi:hypothetical protein
MTARLLDVAYPPGADADPKRAELDAILLKVGASIGRALDGIRASGTRHAMVIVVGRRADFARADVTPPRGVGVWCVLATPRHNVAAGWLDAGRPVDARDLLEARSDAGELPLVFVFGDGTLSLSRVAVRTGGLA